MSEGSCNQAQVGKKYLIQCYSIFLSHLSDPENEYTTFIIRDEDSVSQKDHIFNSRKMQIRIFSLKWPFIQRIYGADKKF